MNKSRGSEWQSYKTNLRKPSKESSSSKEEAVVLDLGLQLDKALVPVIEGHMDQEIDSTVVVIKELVLMVEDLKAHELVLIIMQEVEPENMDIKHNLLPIDQFQATCKQRDKQAHDLLDLVSAQIALQSDSLQEFKEEWERRIIIGHLIWETISLVVKTTQTQEYHQELLDLAHKGNLQGHVCIIITRYLQIDQVEFLIWMEEFKLKESHKEFKSHQVKLISWSEIVKD